MKNMIVKSLGWYLNSITWVAPRKAGEFGFELFCRPIRTKVKPYQLEFLQTAEQLPFTFDGLRVQLYRWGNGPKKVLFLHGWQSHSFRWKKYISSLPLDLFTVYALDAPGHGMSEGNFINVPYYSELIQQFVKDHGAFDAAVAHSLGGMSLLYSLGHHSNMPIKKVVAMGVPGKARDFVNFYQQTLRLSPKTMSIIEDHFVDRIGKPVNYFETEKFVKNLEVPGLIIHDEEDKDAPYMYAKRLHKEWKTSELMTTKGLGHNLKSENVVDEVKAYLLA
jgi:pimeloyl-ACP methyl ester carboxylesterase